MLCLLFGRRLLGANRGIFVEPGVVHFACGLLVKKVSFQCYPRCIPRCCVFVE